jgi:hypothetical protein
MIFKFQIVQVDDWRKKSKQQWKQTDAHRRRSFVTDIGALLPADSSEQRRKKKGQGHNLQGTKLRLKLWMFLIWTVLFNSQVTKPNFLLKRRRFLKKNQKVKRCAELGKLVVNSRVYPSSPEFTRVY